MTGAAAGAANGATRAVWLRAWSACSPAGDWPQTWALILSGGTRIAPVRRFDTGRFPCAVAATVDRFDDPDVEDRRLPMVADALAGLPAHSGRLGVFLGAESGRGSMQTLRLLAQAAGRPFSAERFFVEAAPLRDRLSPSRISPAAPAAWIAAQRQATGPVETLSLACASGLSAVIEAARAVAAGECDSAICGGVGADVDPLMLAGFGKLSALSARGISRPFDAHRDGFVIGEGAALLLISAERPAGMAIRIAGCGRSLDAHHLTMPDPAGIGALAAMRAAVGEARAAGLAVDRLDVVQAHGTSTPLNDAVEARALAALGLPVGAISSVKGALGHWIAGAGALGLCCAAQSLLSQTAPPTAGLATVDHALPDLPHVTGIGRPHPAQTALCNAFAFGGANASVLLYREA